MFTSQGPTNQAKNKVVKTAKYSLESLDGGSTLFICHSSYTTNNIFILQNYNAQQFKLKVKKRTQFSVIKTTILTNHIAKIKFSGFKNKGKRLKYNTTLSIAKRIEGSGGHRHKTRTSNDSNQIPIPWLTSNKLTNESIGLGKALWRAWMITSCCWIGSNLCLATVAASTKLSYPLLLLLSPAEESKTLVANPLLQANYSKVTKGYAPVASWTLFERWFIAKRSNKLSL